MKPICTMISIRHLSKTFRNPDGSANTVLKDVNCEISKGEVISIIGPSGSGKSTLLRAMNMLEPPDSGEIWLNGENITAPSYPLETMRRKMGMVFQNFNLFENMTVMENITCAPVKLLHLSRQQAELQALALLKEVGMAHQADAYPSELSGGQKQRAAIARALAMQPEIILFDEPTSSLDPTMVGEVLSVIRHLAKLGLTMLIVTHEMRFARDVSTRIIFMNEGVIYEDGTPDQIFNHPVHSATKAFVNRIQKLVYEIDSDYYDYYQIHTSLGRFCIKYNIADKNDLVFALIKEVLFEHLRSVRPITVRITHAELSGVTSLDIMVAGISVSPLDDKARSSLGAQVRQIIEEPTTRGFRVKLIV